jgi:hypothetical protein
VSTPAGEGIQATDTAHAEHGRLEDNARMRMLAVRFINGGTEMACAK